jgi:monoamine oxidase
MAERDLDTVVVGGGLAGLAAARRLAEAGRRVSLLEASGRVGGRTRSERLGDGIVDLGAEWTGPRHRRVLGLARCFGLHLEPARLLGRRALWRGAERTGEGRLPRLSAREEVAFARMLWQGRRLARGLDPERPWATAGAERLDAISTAAWLRSMGLRGDGYRFIAAFLGALISAPIERMSLLHLLWWLRRGGGTPRLLETTFRYRLREGAEGLSAGMAADLGARIRVEAPVRWIEQRRRGVEVTTGDGDSVRARHAVIAVPCRALDWIEFAPDLPERLRGVTTISNEPGTKVHALLPADHGVRAHFGFGAGSFAGTWRSGRRITGFAIPPADRLGEETLLADLAAAFGARRGDLEAGIVCRWRDHDYIPGCDVAFAPGQLTRLGEALREPYGRLHFAAAERGSWPNNMEGALESCGWCAEAVLAASP